MSGGRARSLTVRPAAPKRVQETAGAERGEPGNEIANLHPSLPSSEPPALKRAPFPLAVLLDLLRLPIVQFNEFVTRVSMNAQKFIELGLDRLSIPVP
jgi:hypothetical protein